MTNMSIEKLNERISTGQIKSGEIIDVRGKKEYKRGHVPGAVNIPLNKIKKEHQEKMPKSKTYYIICESGQRSRKASSILEELGYKLYNIQGGTGAYRLKFELES